MSGTTHLGRQPRKVNALTCEPDSLIDFAISLLIMAGVMLWYGYSPDWRIVTLPLFLLLAFLPVAGVGILFAALNVKYRDFRYVVQFMLQFGLYVSPVGFASSIVPEKWRLLYALNPMVGVIRWFQVGIPKWECRVVLAVTSAFNRLVADDSGYRALVFQENRAYIG